MIEKIKRIVFKILSKFGIEFVPNETINVNVTNDAVSSDTFVKSEMTESDKEATNAAKDAISQRKNKRRLIIKRIAICIIAIVVVVILIRVILGVRKKNATLKENMSNVTQVKRMNISSEISGSGTLSPKDSYTITSLVEGNITNVFFDIGDKVIKDQLLITIDSQTALRNIANASSSVAEANDNYKQAEYEFKKIEKDYEGRTFKAPYSGCLRSFVVKKGDNLKNGTEIGSIINDKSLIVKVPFAQNDAKRIISGAHVYLEIQETGEFIDGLVSSVAQDIQSINNGVLVRYVTIKCNNPGGLTTENTAMAYINNLVSLEDGSFEIETDEKIVFSDGTNIEVEKLLVSEGAYVEKGTPLFLITEETINNIISTKKRSYLQAKDSLTKAENSYDDSIDSYDEYFITSPIDGTVITKDVKVGDKIQRNTNSTKSLAVIYDLSELSFDMDIDELDISKIKNGQEVNVQADAFGNKVFKGVISNVSLVAANSNGVTNYPVTVTITDAGALLPGMNVDGYVVLSRAEDVLTIPANALQRGNVVYLLNSSKTIVSKEYDNDEISERVLSRVPEGFTAVKVETGISNDNFIEIKSGLQEGDEVYVSTSVANNMRSFNGMSGGMGGGMPPMGTGGRR